MLCDNLNLQVTQRTRTAQHSSDPTWDHKFEFDEIVGGEYLKIKCFLEEMFGEESIGSARVNLEGLVEGSVRDVWIPLERANSGELHLQIEAVPVDDQDGLKVLLLVQFKLFFFFLFRNYYHQSKGCKINIFTYY